MTMEYDEIARYLPHRYPFLLVDRVTEVAPGDRIRGYKNVSVNEPFFNGHFPGNPLMPGVLMVEAMAQLGGILAYKTKSTSPADGIIYYLGGLDAVRYKRVVRPGDRLDMQSRIIADRRNVMKFQCEARVGEELACAGEIICVESRL